MASPVDPRLLRVAPPVTRLIVQSGLMHTATALLVMARGVLIGVTAASVIANQTISLSLLIALAAIICAHGAVSWLAQAKAQDIVGKTIDTLRERALMALAHRDPRTVEEEASTWRHVLTRGMNDFRPYLTEFFPALASVVISTPLALLVVWYFDWVSGVFALVTLPLIPAFMILIGKLTAAHTQRRLDVTAGLGDQLGDLLSGAPTLRFLHATRRPAQQVRETGRRHEKATMSVLRLAFLSSFALEFLATLSVALVAVSIGLRLVYGELDLLSGLVVLIIVPEVFQPLRTVGSAYHAAADGLEAVSSLLSLIDAPPSTTGAYLHPCGEGVVACDVSVCGRDGLRPAHVSFHARPGTITVLAGPNGAGKSTLLMAALGALPDESVTGTMRIDGPVAYLPAHPAVVKGNVKDNLEVMGTPTTSAARSAVGVDIPLEQRVGPAGEGISAGQLQRIGLSRTLAFPASTVLLDEPTAHLSPELVDVAIQALHSAANEGKTVIVASHDHRVLDAADAVVML